MKLIIDENNVETNKNIDNEKFVLLADLHLNKQLNQKMIDLVLSFLYENKVDAILIPGDIMNSSYYTDKICLEKLEYLLKQFGEISKTIISLGNHDIYKMTNEQRNNFDKLNRINNTYALDNAQVKIGNINFLGFSTSHKAYEVDKIKRNNIFIKEFSNANFKIKKDEFNVLLNHHPKPVASNYVQKSLSYLFKDIDLIVSGHLHNGYVPDEIEQFFKNTIKDYGISETPELFPKKIISRINYCRGMHSLKNSKLIITKGFRTYAGYIPSFIETNPHINEINIVKTKKRKF